ncbi:MAG TPA: MFS transporter [Burkholderiaceae bacterium]
MTDSKLADGAAAPRFSGYQLLVVVMLALLQFSIILDFVLMAPLGAVIMPTLGISPREFGLVVSAYAFAAGASGLLTAGFADRFDRKKLLLFFYCGFLLGTIWCGLAQSFESLLAARVFTGIFGGVIGSIVMAIMTDLFPPAMRGRVMGAIQSAFGASQVLGLPIGLYLSNQWNWHMPFLAMAAFGLLVGLFVAAMLQPVNAHLSMKQERSPWAHLLHTVTDRRHTTAFVAVCFLATGGYMLMPFSSTYMANNIGIGLQKLPVIYFTTGFFTIFFGPLIGMAADALGKFRVFVFGAALSITMVLIYTHLPPVTVPIVILVNVVLFFAIMSRMVPFQAMASQVPAPTHRGAFNAISASIQQFAGGLAAVLAGHIVTAQASGKLDHMDTVGYVVAGVSLLSIVLAWNMSRQISSEQAVQKVAAQA